MEGVRYLWLGLPWVLRVDAAEKGKQPGMLKVRPNLGHMISIFIVFFTLSRPLPTFDFQFADCR
jgi:hypothetical protein